LLPPSDQIELKTKARAPINPRLPSKQDGQAPKLTIINYHCRCWLDVHAFYGAVLAPIALILLLNSIAFILVVKQIKDVSGRRSSTYSDKSVSRRNSVVEQFRGALVVFLLLGLTWTMAGEWKKLLESGD